MEQDQLPEAEKCLNCGVVLTDRFCSHCGQDSKEFKRSVWSIAVQFFETFTDFDNKLISSLKPLIIKPGFLTREYLAGKRKTYLNPIQMYAFFSFLFFFTYFYLPDRFENDDTETEVHENETHKKSRSSSADSLEKKGKTIRIGKSNETIEWDFGDTTDDGLLLAGKHYTLAKYDSTQKALPAEKKDNWLKQFFFRKMLITKIKANENSQGLVDNLINGFEQNIPNVIIILLPVFALILKLIYIRRKKYYVEHLIFAIHLHCFCFLYFSIVLIFTNLLLPLNDWPLYTLFAVVYGFFGLKTMYRQGIAKTLIKMILIASSYSVAFIIGLALNLILTLVLLD